MTQMTIISAMLRVCCVNVTSVVGALSKVTDTHGSQNDSPVHKHDVSGLGLTSTVLINKCVNAFHFVCIPLTLFMCKCFSDNGMNF